MKEQFVTYEIALKLKELGFDEPCLAYYSHEEVYFDKDYNKTNFVLLSSKIRGELVGHGSVTNFLFDWLKANNKTAGELYTLSKSVTAPLWQQVIDWFREKYNLLIILDPRSATTDLTWVYAIVYKKNMTEFSVHYYNYYQAREQAILKAIELCQK